MSLLTTLVIILIGDCVWGLRTRSSSPCGVPFSQGKIVGGVDSGGYRYPWFALLMLKKNSFLPVPVCAGSLISSLYVLTAAHCFTITATIRYDNLFSVALGVYNICNDNEKTRQIFNVAGVAVHEKYQKSGKFYDIALIKLDRPADYTSICLPLAGVPDITEVALLVGFGVTEENSNFVPCHLLEVNVTKYSKTDCSVSKLPSEDKKEPSVICAGALTGKVDSCYGDSGGPLQTRTPDGRYVISGIVSYGYGCATPEVPGVYTNVGSYLRWISDKISSLGSKESNIKTGQVSSGFLNTTRRGIPRRQKSDVTFPGQTNSSRSSFGKSRVRILHFGEKTSSDFSTRRKGPSGSSNNPKKSEVSFPE